jgi:hypothetical protein
MPKPDLTLSPNGAKVAGWRPGSYVGLPGRQAGEVLITGANQSLDRNYLSVLRGPYDFPTGNRPCFSPFLEGPTIGLSGRRSPSPNGVVKTNHTSS